MTPEGATPRILVQKFGGSSVADADGRAHLVRHVRRALDEGMAPVLVVSAMGRRPDAYATDTLLSLVAFAGGATDARERDMLMACGETISAVVVAHALRVAGIAATAVGGSETGVQTSGDFGEALICAIDPAPVRSRVAAGLVPVVTGFQGIAPDGAVATLGRGGSDTSAVALGVALEAVAVEIYSDVEGVMTVDPRLYAGARLIPRLSYEELGELAVEGARIMHPRSVDLAGAYEMPLRIRSTFSERSGTCVEKGVPSDALERQRVVTSITPLFPVAFVEVSTPGGQGADDVRCRVLDTFAERDLSLDLINICQEDLYFIVKQHQADRVGEALADLSLPYRMRRDCAKLSIVGVGMRGTPGVVGRIHRSLHQAGIHLLHSTDSNITISCLIDQADVGRAVAALHEAFHMADGDGETLPKTG